MCLVCERSADPNPGEPFICSAPIWRERSEKQKGFRVIRRKSTIWDHKWILQKSSSPKLYTFIDITPIPLKMYGTENVFKKEKSGKFLLWGSLNFNFLVRGYTYQNALFNENSLKLINFIHLEAWKCLERLESVLERLKKDLKVFRKASKCFNTRGMRSFL